MKALNTLLSTVLIALTCAGTGFAQTQAKQNDALKQRLERNEAKRNVYKHAKRMVRKEAKKLQKEGWKTMGLPLEKQLEETWERMSMMDQESGYPRYISAESQASAQSYSGAQMQAENMAKVNIASNIASSISSLTDIAIANQELSTTESIAMQKVVQNSKIQVAQKLGRVLTTQCMYKQDANQYTVRVVALYDLNQAMEIAHQAMMHELELEVKENRAKLERLISTDQIANSYMENVEGK